MNVSKLRIVSYDDPRTRNEVGSMEVMINPETYNEKIEIKYSERQAQGTSGRLPKFTKIEPSKIDFEFLFDRTGVINDLPPGELGVDEDISTLKRLTVQYQGNKHRPRFVSIYWGTLQFDGCLKTMDISYNLFNSQGLPLRAVIKAGFIGAIEDDKRLALENSQSPDLTQIYTVKQGDNLPLLAHKMYGDSKYYIEIAKFNDLDDYRYLKTGDKIKFPPIELSDV